MQTLVCTCEEAEQAARTKPVGPRTPLFALHLWGQESGNMPWETLGWRVPFPGELTRGRDGEAGLPWKCVPGKRLLFKEKKNKSILKTGILSKLNRIS